MATKCFCYLRVSGMAQCDGDGFTRQLGACEKYAASNDMDIVQVYKEMGVSGTKENRAALAEMLVSLEENGHGVKTIICEKLDRLSRDLVVQELLVAKMQKNGINLVSALEGPDLLSSDPTRKFIRQILGAVSELDKSLLVEKLHIARVHKKEKTGRCEGQKGYSIINPSIVRRLRELREEGKTFVDIAFMWNSLEAPVTKTGVLWTASNLERLLRTAKE